MLNVVTAFRPISVAAHTTKRNVSRAAVDKTSTDILTAKHNALVFHSPGTTLCRRIMLWTNITV